VPSFEQTRSDFDLMRTTGFLVADARCRPVGWVEAPMYGTSPVSADALSVRSSFRPWRRRLVPAGAIEVIDEQTRVVGLRIERSSIEEFEVHEWRNRRAGKMVPRPHPVGSNEKAVLLERAIGRDG
jgi:hypothetical protein